MHFLFTVFYSLDKLTLNPEYNILNRPTSADLSEQPHPWSAVALFILPHTASLR